MSSDIVFSLAIEKIREDFGDFISTIFQILIIQKGCTINEINKIIPNIRYKILRFALFLLFNHNIIFLDKICTNENSENFTIENVKIFASIYIPIYRIRFPRFLSIIEKEFGKIGAEIIKLFFEHGHMTPRKIIQKIRKSNIWNFTNIENCLISLSRDNFIENRINFNSYSLENLSINKKNINKNYYKPTNDNNKLWKVSYSKINLFIKIDIAICISEEYFNAEFKSTFKSSISKISGNNIKNISLILFSIDTLIDYVEELIDETINDELFIIAVVENSNSNIFVIEIKNCLFSFKLENILNILQKKIVENLMLNQFGKNLFRIFKILTSYKEINEEDICRECFIDKRSIRKLLYQLYRKNFVNLEEKNKYNVSISNKKISMWKLNVNVIKKNFLNEIYKAIFNVLIKIEHLKIKLQKKIYLVKKNNLNETKSFFQINILRMSIIRLDELLILLE